MCQMGELRRLPVLLTHLHPVVYAALSPFMLYVYHSVARVYWMVPES